MPQLIIRGMKTEDVRKISPNLIDELQTVVKCPRDYFTIEALPAAFIHNGESNGVLIQVNWFDRGQQVQDQAAAAITRHIQEAGYAQVEIYFIILEPRRYYENGEHY